MRLLGNIEAKVDAKGRAFLPASFRKVLSASGEETLVLRRDIFEACLVIYPQSVWNAEMDALRKRLNRFNRKEQMVFRQFVSGVVDLGIDGNGRILIPRTFLEQVGIGQNIRFIGMGDTIEVWPNDNQQKTLMDANEFSETLQQIMSEDDRP
jgi:MraZ protein